MPKLFSVDTKTLQQYLTTSQPQRMKSLFGLNLHIWNEQWCRKQNKPNQMKLKRFKWTPEGMTNEVSGQICKWL